MGNGEAEPAADRDQRIDPKMEPWIHLFVLVALLGVLILIVRIVTLPVERPPAYSAPTVAATRAARP